MYIRFVNNGHMRLNMIGGNFFVIFGKSDKILKLININNNMLYIYIRFANNGHMRVVS